MIVNFTILILSKSETKPIPFLPIFIVDSFKDHTLLNVRGQTMSTGLSSKVARTHQTNTHVAIYVTVLPGILKGWNSLCPDHPRRAGESALHFIPWERARLEPTLYVIRLERVGGWLKSLRAFLARLCLRAVHECIYDKVYRRVGHKRNSVRWMWRWYRRYMSRFDAA